MHKILVLTLILPITGCEHTKSKPATAPAEPTASNERVINPWSGSSHPNSLYRPLGQTSNIINPWEKHSAPTPAQTSDTNGQIPTTNLPSLTHNSQDSQTSGPDNPLIGQYNATLAPAEETNP